MHGCWSPILKVKALLSFTSYLTEQPRQWFSRASRSGISVTHLGDPAGNTL